MITQEEKNKIKSVIEEFFYRMTFSILRADIDAPSLDLPDLAEVEEKNSSVVEASVKMQEPQVLIGQNGQTLFEIQRILRLVLNKKLQKIFYLNLDINDYKKKKTDYLKDLARAMADRVFLERQEKALPPMFAYERKIIHSELAKRTDISAESVGEGPERHIIIKPK